MLPSSSKGSRDVRRAGRRLWPIPPSTLPLSRGPTPGTRPGIEHLFDILCPMGSRHDSTPFPERARTLSPRQIGAPVTTAETPVPVRAWVLTVRGDEFEVDAEALAWTQRAVRIAYTDKHGRLDTAWVWASAVRRR